MTDTTDIVQRLRATPNWQRESFDHWETAICHYDRAPFEAAETIEALRGQVADWLRANGPGGWIDDLRAQVAAMKA